MNNRTTKQAVACTKTATLRGKLTDGITMAKRLLVAVALAVAFFGSAYAQQQVAVLQRGDSVLGVYYGVNSFIDAMNASANGDIITLSGGTFNSPTYGNALSKALTIRGAGAVEDTARGILPTIFTGNFYCDNIPATATYHLTVEGVMFVGYLSRPVGGNFTIQSPEFIRCIFNDNSNTISLNNGIYVNCVFKKSTSTGNGYNNGTFTNCVLWGDAGDNGTINLNNCVVRTYEDLNINAYNTIFFRRSSASGVTDGIGSNLYNCVLIGVTLSNVLNSTNTVLPADSLSAVFATFTNSSNDINHSTSYALTDSAAANFLGIDGTQVGIYGGAMPFGYVPTYNVIRRCTVAPRSTADGKLSVDIELETEQ